MGAISDKVLNESEHGFNIPSKPATLTKLQVIMSQEDPSIFEMASVISKDVGLSAAIIKTINSPIYGMSNRISDVKQAAMLLGLSYLSAIVVGILLRQSISGKACISLDDFWDMASDVALSMNHIGDKLSHVKCQGPIEELYTVGLFHDCGIPAFALKYPDYIHTLTNATENQLSLPQLEQEQYRSDHAVIGYYIAKAWGLPSALCDVIREHHNVNFLKNRHEWPQTIYAVLHLSLKIVHTIKEDPIPYEWQLIEGDVMDHLGLIQSDEQDFTDEIRDLIQNEGR